jgi:hypothetical protein
MGQKSNVAAVMDALNMLKKEECALSMEQRSSYAVLMDARTKRTLEEGMGQKSRSSDAVLTDAQMVS